MSDSLKNKKQTLYLVLCGIFLTNAVVAEVIGTKIFSIEDTLGIDPLQIPLFGQKFNFNMSAGVLIWPFVFITSDIINEYFGKSGVKKISYLTAILIAYSFQNFHFQIKTINKDTFLMRLSNDSLLQSSFSDILQYQLQRYFLYLLFMT